VAAFGQILRKNVLELPPYGCVNAHASLLPRWRGASPIQASILAGDAETGITIMKMDEGVDTGDILHQESLKIQAEDTTETLTDRLAVLGAALLIKTLPDYLAGRIQPIRQDHASATYAPMIKKEQSYLDITRDAASLANQVRAFLSWPVARIQLRGQEVLIHKASAILQESVTTGHEYRVNRFPAVGTGNGLLVLEQVQLPGKKVISGKDYLNGVGNWGTIKP
jgi:methionyl-tRNA formyltransferase